jgi:hypothetical protein
LPYTPIENADIDKNTNRFTSASGTTNNDAGQVVTDSKFRAMSFGYDANGRMVKAAKANVPDALSVYDALGNRVATKFNDLWQFVIYDAFGKLVAEYCTPPGNSPFMIGTTYGTFTLRVITNELGQVKSRRAFMPFGEELTINVGERSQPLKYGTADGIRQNSTGYQKDEETQLDFAEARMYENRHGRFAAVDPVVANQSISRKQAILN